MYHRSGKALADVGTGTAAEAFVAHGSAYNALASLKTQRFGFGVDRAQAKYVRKQRQAQAQAVCTDRQFAN